MASDFAPLSAKSKHSVNAGKMDHQNIAQLLFWITKHAGLRKIRCTRWIAFPHASSADDEMSKAFLVELQKLAAQSGGLPAPNIGNWWLDRNDILGCHNIGPCRMPTVHARAQRTMLLPRS